MVGLVVGLLVGLSPLAQASESNTIRSFCLAAFDAAMAQAGKTPPEGMGPFTCDCFLKQAGRWHQPGPRHLQSGGRQAVST